MPPKRTWSQANENGAQLGSPAARARAAPSREPIDAGVPSISRKVTACASCRKQKIRCIMDKKGPPCRRCTERGLSCILNKSLQTLIEERSHWKDTVIDDLHQMHSSLQHVLAKLSLPQLPSLRTGDSQRHDDSGHLGQYEEEEALAYDDSPPHSPAIDDLPHAPIDSLYEITRLRTLRTDEATNGSKDHKLIEPLDDFISRGLLSIQDAERLVDQFINRIDHFMYKIGAGQHRNLDSLRRRSPVLTAAICTVAALHDPNGFHLYVTCGREFRRLMSASMFDRRLSQDCMRAACVAAYWLHDLSWMISGYAIRRAMELNLSHSYQQVLTNADEEAMDNLRIWYLLFICDRHLSVLYGRPSIVRDDDESTSGWRKIIGTSLCTESDKRLLGQLDLLKIMCKADELFGPDNGGPISAEHAQDLEVFGRQIDAWLEYWCSTLLSILLQPIPFTIQILIGLETHENLGDFPLKGAKIHHHLAKLHLYSHVFRGLKGAPVPEHFQTSAVAAVGAAISIIDMVLHDENIRDGLAGIPHYIHSMIAFACVFLLKTSTQYPGIYLDAGVATDLTTRAVKQFRETPVGKRHLVHLMANGLEKMIVRRTARSTAGSEPTPMPGSSIMADALATSSSMGTGDHNSELIEGGNVLNFDDTLDFGTASFLNFDTGTIALDFTGFEF